MGVRGHVGVRADSWLLVVWVLNCLRRTMKWDVT